MRHSNCAPLYRSTVGFDRLATLMETVAGQTADVGYPPYDIERLSENHYRITMAVAGFTETELTIEVTDTTLRIRGVKTTDDKERTFSHRGIAARNFERRFVLADHVEVTGADLKDGLLAIHLARNVPERMKPRLIPLGRGGQPEIIAQT